MNKKLQYVTNIRDLHVGQLYYDFTNTDRILAPAYQEETDSFEEVSDMPDNLEGSNEDFDTDWERYLYEKDTTPQELTEEHQPLTFVVLSKSFDQVEQVWYFNWVRVDHHSQGWSVDDEVHQDPWDLYSDGVVAANKKLPRHLYAHLVTQETEE